MSSSISILVSSGQTEDWPQLVPAGSYCFQLLPAASAVSSSSVFQLLPASSSFFQLLLTGSICFHLLPAAASRCIMLLLPATQMHYAAASSYFQLLDPAASSCCLQLLFLPAACSCFQPLLSAASSSCFQLLPAASSCFQPLPAASSCCFQLFQLTLPSTSSCSHLHISFPPLLPAASSLYYFQLLRPATRCCSS